MIRWALTVACLLGGMPLAADEGRWARCEPDAPRLERETLTPEIWTRIEERGDRITNGTGKFWKITTQSGATSYLWGTMHTANPRLSHLPDDVEDVLLSSRIVLAEFDGDNLTWAQTHRNLAGEGFWSLTPPTRLQDSLAPGVALALNARLEQFGIDATHSPNIRPEALMALLLTLPCEDRLLGAGYPIQDTVIEVSALARGIPVRSIDIPDLIEEYARDPSLRDSFVATLSMLAMISGYQIFTIDNPAFPSQASFQHYYVTGQLGRYRMLDHESMRAFMPEVDYDALGAAADRHLLGDRNRDMVENARAELEAGDAFIAVGFYHLFGDDGLVALLRAQGMQVERVIVTGEIR